MVRLAGVLLWAITLFAACGGDPGQPTSTAIPLEPAAERALKLGATPKPAAQVVDETAVSRLPRLAAPLPDELAIRVRSAPVPVLLPDDPAWLRQVVFTSGRDWYAATLHVDGLVVTLSGTRLAFHTPTTPPAQADYPLALSHHQGIATAAWGRGGVSYLVRMGCGDPVSDARCTGDEYLRGLIARLALAGATP